MKQDAQDVQEEGMNFGGGRGAHSNIDDSLRTGASQQLQDNESQAPSREGRYIRGEYDDYEYMAQVQAMQQLQSDTDPSSPKRRSLNNSEQKP